MGPSRDMCCVLAIAIVVLCVSVPPSFAHICPELNGEWGVPAESANSVAVSNGHVYLSTTDDAEIGGLKIIDETNLVEVGSLSLGTDCWENSLVVSGQYAYVNCWSNEPFYVQVIDVSDPTQPYPVGVISGLGRVDAVRNGLAYTLTEDRVRVVDVTDPTQPDELGSVVVDPGYLSHLGVSGDHLYVTGSSLGSPSDAYLWAIDVTRPWEPEPIGFVQVGDFPFAGELALTDDYAYVVCPSGIFWFYGIGIVDIQDPEHMLFVTQEVAGGVNTSVATDGRSLFTTVSGYQEDDSMTVYDVRDPLAVSVAGYIYGEGGHDSVVSGTRYFVVDGGLRVYDTSICAAGLFFQDDFESGDPLAWSGEHAISWWPADGNADDAIGTNHGTLHGGAGFTTGAVDQAFSFDGVDDYVSITHDPFLDLGTGSFSVAFWLKTQSSAGTIVQKGPDFRVYLVFDHPRLSVAGYIFTGTPIADDSFHHVAFTIDRFSDNGTRVYIDGVLIEVFDPVPQWMGTLNNSEDLLIGWDGGTDFFEGAIDEVMLFRRVITPDEVAALAGVR